MAVSIVTLSPFSFAQLTPVLSNQFCFLATFQALSLEILGHPTMFDPLLIYSQCFREKQYLRDSI